MPAPSGEPRHTSADPAQKPNAPEPAGLAAGFQQFHDEAAGMIDVRVARAADFLGLAELAELGERVALAFIAGMASLRKRVKRLERPLCASCDFVFFPRRPPAGLLLLLPAVDEPSQMIVAGICPDCAEKTDVEIIAAFAVHAKAKLWPDLRVIDAVQMSRERGRA